MNLPRFFVDRPVFAAVVSIVITLLGGLAYFQLPVSQYPEVIPPTVVVSATYPGANAEVLADTVATPLEQEINGVENMLYLSSSSTSDGRLSITVTFKLGTDLNQAQVLVQNRVNAALPRLPEEVRRLGVTALKRSPDLTMAIQFYSPDDTRDVLYLANYVNLQVQNRIARVPGVAEASTLGGLDFTMRIWLDPEKLAVRNLTAGDVVSAIREQNVQVAAGQLGQPPAPSGLQFQYTLTTQGRLRSAEQFGRIVLRTGTSGDVIRLQDVARIELGGKDYAVKSYRDGKNSVSLRVFQLPGTNALQTSDAVYAAMDDISKRFPPGVDYSINYDPTKFVRSSMKAVLHTLVEAVLLVVLVVVVFLQSWRASVIPLLAVPVSLVGTLAVMSAFGFSLNNLSLFGLVLAIGIVVDDAIVVVENVERYLAKGFTPREATLRAMKEVTGPVVAIALVLCAVFVPTAFLGGITGEFYRQFALTITASTVISAINSLTLSPALAALLLRHHEAKPDIMTRIIEGLLGWFFRIFNRVFGAMSDMYAKSVAKIIRQAILSLLIYGGLIAFAVHAFKKVPSGFIPAQDMGYFMTVIQLPDGASFERSDEIVRRVDALARETPGVAHTFAISGYSNVLQANQSNLGACFIIPDEFENRTDPSLSANALMATLRKKFADIQEARVLVLPPPPLRGLGNAGGFKLQVEDLNNAGLPALEAATRKFLDALAAEPGFSSMITGFRANNPQFNLVIDRERAKTMNVSISAINDTLQTYLGSTYVNDFNLFGRTWQVMAMAEPGNRMKPEDIGRLRTRNMNGEMVPLGALVKVERIGGADRVQRYNMFVSSDISGSTSAEISSGEMIQRVDELAKQHLPEGFDYEWTDLTYQQILAGNSIVYIFPLCVLFVFLVLSAQYESWALPLAVILIVPMCLLSAIGGVWISGMDNNIFTQIGLVVLVGLASKNAILIVEFARQQQDLGMSRFDAAVEACRLRLRPILMTSFAFILGVLPLVLAKGAGAEMRNALGTAVFYGMLGVTFFGLIFTPVFYVVIAKFMKDRKEIKDTPDALKLPHTVPHATPEGA
ncbi:multidrug efflux RND transporter permease subunit [Verrucomicrobium sp. BvORR106]|uniref:efflux RND transporter permease subunit n=1 Tax=Verrucomicrobium sp. BvORR106 TaxID=1403819 RepID=UPI00056F0A69|nr:multidrug efflux RND transporter permease subunit [Verrucomicrobium sp. BvORR106]